MNNRLLQVLSIKPFFSLWMAEIFSQLAINMMNFVLIVVAFELTNSNTAVSGIVLSFTLPAIVFGVLAGIYVDRHDKKRILFITNITRALLLLLLATMHTDLLIIYAISLLVSIITQFFIPAETPIIPLVVENKLLIAANALFSVGIFGSILVAYALSGPFLLYLGESNVFIFLAMLFLIAAFFVTFITIPPKIDKVEKKLQKEHNVMTFRTELTSLFRLMVKTKEIYHSLFLLTMAQVIILILAVIGPGYARNVLDVDPNKFPIFFVTPAALGMFIGAILIGNYFHGHKKESLATLGVILSGIAILLMPFGAKGASSDFIHILNTFLPGIFAIDILHIMILLAFVLGVANALVFVPSNTLLQEKTSEAFRGKIYGALNAFVGIFSLLPVIIVGSLADVVGVPVVLTGIGVCVLSFGLSRVFYK